MKKIFQIGILVAGLSVFVWGQNALMRIIGFDTDDSNYIEIVWNEDDSSNRVLNIKVNSGNRTLDMNEGLTIGDGNDGTLTYSAASKTLTVEDNATVSQDYSSDATPTFAGITLDSGSGGDLRIHDSDQSNYTSITQAAIAGNLSLVLPATDGNSGDVFTTNGSGTTSWADPDTLVYKNVILKVMAEDTVVTSGDGKMYFTVPAELAGFDVVSVECHVYTVDAANDVEVDIYNLTQTADVMSDAQNIQANENDSLTSDDRGTIDTSEDDLTSGDVLRVDVSLYAGSAAKGLEVRLGLLKP